MPPAAGEDVAAAKMSRPGLSASGVLAAVRLDSLMTANQARASYLALKKFLVGVAAAGWPRGGWPAWGHLATTVMRCRL